MLLNKPLVFVFALLLTLNLNSQSKDENSNLIAAFRAQGSLNLKKATSLFKMVIQDKTANDEEKCKALRALGVIKWKFYKNYQESKRLLLQADSIGHYKSETWLKINRVERKANNYSEAIKAIRNSIKFSESKSDRTYANYLYGKTILEKALQNNYSHDSLTIAELKEASNILNNVLQTNPTNVNAAETLLGISVLLKEGKTALKSWMAYYRFLNADNAYDYLKKPAKSLENILPKWEADNLSLNDSMTLIKAFSQSRFYAYAKLIANDLRQKKTLSINEQKEVDDTILYASYLKDIKELTNEYYRLSSIGEGNTDMFLDNLFAKNHKLYNALVPTKSKSQPYSLPVFREFIRENFGTALIIAATSSSNITGLIMGQIVNERIRNVEQYGRSADFNFTELDMMVSNGYPSWFWEDRGAGGFAIQGGFLRVKTMFKYLGIEAWAKVSDPVRIEKIKDKINSNLLTSNKLSNRSNVLSGLAKKLNLDALNQLYNSLKGKGFTEIELQLKFIEAYDSLRDDATMFAHEGRHSLDRIFLEDEHQNQGIVMTEYRGRLSQIAFSESPKIELANMINSIGSHGAGLSNKMIVDVLEDWINHNSQLIQGFNKNMLPISQAYLLTDEQIRTCFKEVDPFYINRR